VSGHGEATVGRKGGQPVSRSIIIERPAHEVAQQFCDVDHHERSGVHAGTSFHVIDQDDDHCDYEQLSRVGPSTIRQRFHLDRTDRLHQINMVTGGSFQGGTLAFDIVETGVESAEVTATLTPPRTMATRLLGPVLRRLLGRSLAAALEEDRDDLESGRYASATTLRIRLEP